MDDRSNSDSNYPAIKLMKTYRIQNRSALQIQGVEGQCIHRKEKKKVQNVDRPLRYPGYRGIDLHGPTSLMCKCQRLRIPSPAIITPLISKLRLRVFPSGSSGINQPSTRVVIIRLMSSPSPPTVPANSWLEKKKQGRTVTRITRNPEDNPKFRIPPKKATLS